MYGKEILFILNIDHLKHFGQEGSVSSFSVEGLIITSISRAAQSLLGRNLPYLHSKGQPHLLLQEES